MQEHAQALKKMMRRAEKLQKSLVGLEQEVARSEGSSRASTPAIGEGRPTSVTPSVPDEEEEGLMLGGDGALAQAVGSGSGAADNVADETLRMMDASWERVASVVDILMPKLEEATRQAREFAAKFTKSQAKVVRLEDELDRLRALLEVGRYKLDPGLIAAPELFQILIVQKDITVLST